MIEAIRDVGLIALGIIAVGSGVVSILLMGSLFIGALRGEADDD